MLLTLKRSFLIGSLVALAGCSILENPSQYKPVGLTKYNISASVSTIWSADIGSDGGVGFAPLVLDQFIYAATPTSLSKVNAANGQVVWRVKSSGQLSAGVGSDGNIVVVNTQDGKAQAYSAANGELLWTSTLSTISSTPPVVSNGVVVVRADDYRVIAFKADDGSLLWSHLRTTPSLALKASSQMVVFKDILFVGVPTGRLLALDLYTGNQVLDLGVASPNGSNEIQRVVDVVGKPFVMDNAICVGAYQSQISCHGTNQLNALWILPYSTNTGIEIGDDSFLSTGSHGEVTSIDPVNGQIKWQNTDLTNRGLTNAVNVGDYVLVGDYEGYIHLLNKNTGELVGRNAVAGNTIESPIQVFGLNGSPALLVQTIKGKLIALGAR